LIIKASEILGNYKHSGEIARKFFWRYARFNGNLDVGRRNKNKTKRN
jgi:hypothetical protein